jgi:colicin import membrane protein
MRAGLIISVSVHAIVLLWGLLTFAPRPMNAAPPDALPVDLISITDYSQLTAGAKTAPKTAAAKPLVEKVSEAKPAEDPTAKVAEKLETTTASALMPEQVPTPVPDPRPASAPPPAHTQPAVQEPQKKSAEATREPKVEAIKREEPKKPEPVKEQVAAPTPPRKPPPPQPKFDANRIAALLDKRDPQRRAATGELLNPTASLGSPRGAAPTLTQSELDALRAQIQACWNPPAGAADDRNLIVLVKIVLRQDGSLAADPVVLNRGNSPMFQIAAESAMRAVRRCQPYRLPIAKYEIWKDVEVTFDPRDLYRG